jgi:hypothetical protein
MRSECRATVHQQRPCIRIDTRCQTARCRRALRVLGSLLRRDTIAVRQAAKGGRCQRNPHITHQRADLVTQPAGPPPRARCSPQIRQRRPTRSQMRWSCCGQGWGPTAPFTELKLCPACGGLGTGSRTTTTAWGLRALIGPAPESPPTPAECRRLPRGSAGLWPGAHQTRRRRGAPVSGSLEKGDAGQCSARTPPRSR